jgi:fluoride exporter
MELIFISIGGIIGTFTRCLLYLYFQNRFGAGFFYATILINIAGSFFAGFFYHLSEEKKLFSLNVRNLLLAGFCGSMTTFSQFIIELAGSIEQGMSLAFCLNFFYSLAGGLLFFIFGKRIAKVVSF